MRIIDHASQASEEWRPGVRDAHARLGRHGLGAAVRVPAVVRPRQGRANAPARGRGGADRARRRGRDVGRGGAGALTAGQSHRHPGGPQARLPQHRRGHAARAGDAGGTDLRGLLRRRPRGRLPPLGAGEDSRRPVGARGTADIVADANSGTSTSAAQAGAHDAGEVLALAAGLGGGLRRAARLRPCGCERPSSSDHQRPPPEATGCGACGAAERRRGRHRRRSPAAPAAGVRASSGCGSVPPANQASIRSSSSAERLRPWPRQRATTKLRKRPANRLAEAPCSNQGSASLTTSSTKRTSSRRTSRPALLRALGDVGERLRADQVVVADLLGHHLEQQPVLVRRQRRGLAGLLDAGDRLLNGSRAGGGGHWSGGGGAWRRGAGPCGVDAAAGAASAAGPRRRSRHFAAALAERAGCGAAAAPGLRLGARRRRGDLRWRAAGRRRPAPARAPPARSPSPSLAVTLGVEGEVGRLVRQLDLGGQLLAQQLAEAAGAGPAGGDGLLVPERTQRPVGQRLERHRRGGGAHAGNHLGQDLAPHLLDLGGRLAIAASPPPPRPAARR